MSTLLLQLNVVFFIILLQTIKTASSASINYHDYNSFDINDKDSDKNCWNKDNTNSKEPANKAVYYFQECKPLTSSTTSAPPSPIPTGNNTNSEIPSVNEAQDIVVHVIKILRSMKNHALALIKNMNELEMDILSSSSSSHVEQLCKNSTDGLSGTNEDMDKLASYPDVLSQKQHWSAPLKISSILESGQTNEFLTEAHEAVKSWKQEIDACKNILDNAVHNALRNVNLKSNIAQEDQKSVKDETKYSIPALGYYKDSTAIGFEELSKDLKQEQEKSQNAGRNKKYKFHSLYDALRIKEED